MGINWRSTVIVVNKNQTERVNVTDIGNYSTKNRTYVNIGYNTVSWSIPYENDVSNISLETGEWAYLYDALNNTWHSYLKGVGGENFRITPYDVILVNLKSARWLQLHGG